MRIVSWNCNGALRKKISHVSSLEADIYIIQECEDPASSDSEVYRAWASNYLWTGGNKNKGLGVFASSNIRLDPVALPLSPLELFLPCRINGSIPLLAAWTREAGSPTFRYIGQLWKLLQRHARFLDAENAILMGDLNSNSCWDVPDRWWNHSDVVRELRNIGLLSAYHHFLGEAQGHETIPTFYMYRRRNRPYHIDYAFVSKCLLKEAVLTIGDPGFWLEASDHLPLLLALPSLDFP